MITLQRAALAMAISAWLIMLAAVGPLLVQNWSQPGHRHAIPYDGLQQ